MKKNCPIKKIFKNLNLCKYKNIIRPILIVIVVLIIGFVLYNNFLKSKVSIRDFVPQDTTQLIYIDTKNDFIQKTILNQENNDEQSGFQYIIKNIDNVILGQIISSNTLNTNPSFVIIKLSKNADLNKLKENIKKYETDGFEIQHLSDNFFVYGSPDIISMIQKISEEKYLNKNIELQQYISKNTKKSLFFTVKITDQLQKLVNNTYPVKGIKFVIAEADIDNYGGIASIHILFDKNLNQTFGIENKQYSFVPKFTKIFGKNSLLGFELGPITDKFIGNNINIQNILKQMLGNNQYFQLLTEQDYKSLAGILSDNFFVGIYNSIKGELPIGIRILIGKDIIETRSKLIGGIENYVKLKYPNIAITEINEQGQKGLVLNITQLSGGVINFPIIMTNLNNNAMITIGYPEQSKSEMKINLPKNTIFSFVLNIEKLYQSYQNYITILGTLGNNAVVPPFPNNLKGKNINGGIEINKKSIDINLELK